MLELKVLVGELGTVDALASRAVMVSEIPLQVPSKRYNGEKSEPSHSTTRNASSKTYALAHESRDD
jgi:hypothetical protein